VGVLLVESKKVFSLKANFGTEPKQVRVSNITDSSFTVTWVTNKESIGQLYWGENNSNLDNTEAVHISYPNYIHSITVNNLPPSSDYFFKIASNGKFFDSSGIAWKTSTLPSIGYPQKANLISGVIKTQNGMAVANALVFANVGGGTLISTTTEKNGSWFLSVSMVRNQEGNDYLTLTNETAVELSVFAGPFGNATAHTNIGSAKPVPTIELGKSYNFKNGSFVKYDVPDASVSF